MHGIAAILHYEGTPVGGGELVRLAFGSVHEPAVTTDGPVGLVQWGAAGPATDTERQLAVVADARLDDVPHMCAELGVAGAPDVSELVLEAYARWGAELVDHLVGDFTFAIWDGRERRLLCARDGFGVEPLAYHHGPAHFVLGSSVAAVLSHRAVSRALNPTRIGDYLVGLEAADDSSTCFREVERLPPGHVITVRAGRMEMRRYWHPEDSLPEPERSEQQWLDRLRHDLESSVANRLDTAGPVGSMLSGGLDSSIITAIADRESTRRGARLRTFSAVVPGEEGQPESGFIEKMVASIEATADRARPSDLEGREPTLTEAALGSDDLFALELSSTIPQLMFARARQSGVAVVLDGIDGDLIASLPPSYLAHLIRRGAWLTGAREARGLSRFYRRFGISSVGFLWRYGLKPLLPASWRSVWRRARRADPAADRLRASWISPACDEHIQLRERVRRTQRDLDSLFGSKDTPQSVAQVAGAQVAAALERYHRHAALAGVEARHPFFDRHLFETCAALPRHLKVDKGWSKIGLRRAFAGELPHDVLWRRGWEHLGASFARTRIAQDASLVDDVIHQGLEPLADFVDRGAVRRQHATRPPPDSDLAWSLWRVAMCSVWIERARAGVD